ncbi:hypothetical protein BDN72DRAFT_938193, partial [Pluteus cervinus]
ILHSDCGQRVSYIGRDLWPQSFYISACQPLVVSKPAVDYLSVRPIFEMLPHLPMETLVLSGNSVDDNTSVLLADLDKPGTIKRLEVIQVFIPAFTSIIHNQNQRIREVVNLKDVRDIGKKMGSGMKAQCRSILTFHKLNVLEYYGDYKADVNGLGMFPEVYEEAVEDEINPWWCATVLSDKNGRFSRRYFDVLGEWLKWRRAVGLGVREVVFNNMNIPPKTYLERLCRGVHIECVDATHVIDPKRRMKVLSFEPNPNA